ncbi:lipoprotein [Streptomyces sp. NPDC001744]|uniref:lipoprotein n=1 Tax=Streptomyces sp. NPDC001744 TaxID=3364606 RepID=UPI0036C5BB5A
MRLPIRLLVPVLLAAGPLLSGCGPEPLPEVTGGARPTAGPPGTGAPAAPAAGASLGGPGTACVLPVSFTLAAEWKPKAVVVPEGSELAELARRGPAVMRCEIDAKPAGHLGFLRVWTAEKGSARAVLEGFVTAGGKSPGASYRETTAGALPAVEATYTVRSESLDGNDAGKEARAFAVTTPRGVVVVDLGGSDTGEHRAMLPAYELARTTLKGS